MGLVFDVILPLALAFIMFSLGLGLTGADFARIARQPRDFIVGAASQLILLPLVAFGLLSIWSVPPEIALGVMIIAAAPGGATSNILTAFGRGDVALSVSLTAVISLVCVLTIPLIVVFAYEYFIGGEAGDVSVARTAISVFLIVTIPVLLGMAVRRFAPHFSQSFEPKARIAAMVLFALVLLGAIIGQRDNIVAYFAQAGLITLTLNVVMMTLAYIIAAFLASGPKQRIAITVECGLQNGTLAIAVATVLFGGGLATVPAATYSLIMFPIALIFVAICRRRVPA